MGRYDLRPARVHAATSQILSTQRLTHRPPWYDTVGAIPPSAILTRSQPVIHNPKKRRRASKMFHPQKMEYPEDKLRQTFFGDHPWELARPRVIVEEDGKDSRGWNWPSIQPRGRQLNGESVVQRQMWLMEKRGMSKSDAYDRARSEFYEARARQDVERYVAKEEALSTGAYFGKGPIQIGLELEDQAVEHYKDWLVKRSIEIGRSRSVMNSGSAIPDEPEAEEDPDGKEEAADEASNSEEEDLVPVAAEKASL